MTSPLTAAAAPNGALLGIGIIGFGAFGQFLAETMIKKGHLLTATSKSDHSEVCSQMGIRFYRGMGEFFEADNQVVVMCMSILSMADALRSIPVDHHNLPQLFVDVLSVKEYPRDQLLNVLPVHIDVLCTHPMFGPESGKNGWKGLPLVYEKVRIRDHELCSKFLDIFKTEGCTMVEMSCEEHDKMAAQSQFLTHTIGRALAEMEVKSTPVNTKGFETLLQLRDNTVKDSFDLFCGMFEHNRFAKQELVRLELAFDTVRKRLLERNNSGGNN